MKNKVPLQNVRNSVQLILKTSHFINWFEKQDRNIQEKIQFRLDSIELEGHFGVINFFDGIIELKWKSGLRIYTSRLRSDLVVWQEEQKMDKKKILKKRKNSLKKSKKVILYRHKVQDTKYINQETIKSILIEALMEGDLAMLKDALITQIHLHKKMDLVRKSKLGRQTLYDLIDGKREFNPTVKTLSSLLKAIAS